MVENGNIVVNNNDNIQLMSQMCIGWLMKIEGFNKPRKKQQAKDDRWYTKPAKRTLLLYIYIILRPHLSTRSNRSLKDDKIQKVHFFSELNNMMDMGHPKNMDA